MQPKNSTSKRTIKRTPTTKRKDKMDEFERGLHEFASQAYTEALDYYSKHHNNPAALNELQIRNPGEIHPEWVELSKAIAVIAKSKVAPRGLKEPMLDFLCSESSGIWGDLMARPPVIQRILVAASCREEEVSHAEN